MFKDCFVDVKELKSKDNLCLPPSSFTYTKQSLNINYPYF